jgi:dTMP kinase
VRQERDGSGTRVGESIRKIILNKLFKEMRPETELLLYLAARAQIVREKILPALRKGTVVICDRFEDSTMAYQGYGRGISIPVIKSLGRFVCNVGAIHESPLRPDLTFLLDLDPAKGMKRGGRHDRLERASLAFHRKVRRGFLRLARQEPNRFVVLSGQEPAERVRRKIEEKLNALL